MGALWGCPLGPASSLELQNLFCHFSEELFTHAFTQQTSYVNSHATSAPCPDTSHPADGLSQVPSCSRRWPDVVGLNSPSQSEGVRPWLCLRDHSPKGTMIGQVILYATTTVKTFNIHAYSRPYWKSMVWSWGRRQQST